MVPVDRQSTQSARDRGSTAVAPLRIDPLGSALLDRSVDGVLAFDRDCRYTYWNSAMERITGIDRNRAIGARAFELFPFLIEIGEDQFFHQALRGKSVVSRERPYRIPHTARQGYFEGHYSPLQENGQVVGAVAIVKDITVRKTAEEAFRRSELRFRKLVEQSPLSIQTYAPDGQMRTCNAAWEELFGVTPEQVKDYNILRDPQLLERGVMPLIRKAFTGETVTIPPIPYIPDRGLFQGQVRWCGAFMYPVKDASGAVDEVVLIHEDLTAHKQYEQALSLYREIFANSNDGIAIIDTMGYYLEQNTAHSKLTGFSDEDLKGQTPAIHLGNEKFLEIAQALAASGQWLGEVVSHTKPGRDVPVELSAFAVRNDAGEPTCYVGVKRDVSDRKRAEAEREQLLEAERAARSDAERANRIKDEFLATLSHELRTPLNAILGWCQLLRTGTLSEEESREGLEIVERNARVQTEIISDLLDMSRIVSGKLRLEVQPVDLPEVIRAAVSTVDAAAEGKGIRLVTRLETCVGPVAGDFSRLQQVLWNLLSNAIKFTPAGGEVRVELAQESSRACITVSDTGPGIKPEFIPFLFERFRQADSSSTRHHGGLGLGLAIVKSLMELHGGTVQVSPRPNGGGARFVLTLPLSDTGADAPARTTESLLPTVRVDAATLAGIKVLAVDDEPDARALISRLLESSGAEVQTAASVDEALQALEQFRPAVLVSDISMPGADGYELVRRLRAHGDEQTRRIPAVALTAFARPEDRVRALSSGFDTHLTKPAEPAELIGAVATLAKG